MLLLRFQSQAFIDMKFTRATAGRGGDGCISFLQAWANEAAGPDGGDGGNGGHVIYQVNIIVVRVFVVCRC